MLYNAGVATAAGDPLNDLVDLEPGRLSCQTPHLREFGIGTEPLGPLNNSFLINQMFPSNEKSR